MKYGVVAVPLVFAAACTGGIGGGADSEASSVGANQASSSDAAANGTSAGQGGSGASAGANGGMGGGTGGAAVGGECSPGETRREACDGDGNVAVLNCDPATRTFVAAGTLYGCTVQSAPGAGTRVCPGETFTRSCWPIAGGQARVDWECQGSMTPGDSGFAEVDRDYCTATSGPEAGQHFCPGEVILRDQCPGARNYYICPDTQDSGASFALHETLSCNIEALEWEPLHRGVELRRWTSNNHRFRALRIDLCDVSLRIEATAYADRGKTTSAWGASRGMIAAVNGGFFLPGYVPDGCVAFGQGAEWPTSGDTGYRSFIAFGPREAYLSQAPTINLPPYPMFSWMEEAVCGDATLVLGGVPQAIPASPARARTGAGLSPDRKTLFLLTVDENGSAGLSVGAFAPELAALGVDYGINLDGGGSTTMWTERLGVVNVPTAGSQRVVANHLGVFIDGGATAYNCVP